MEFIVIYSTVPNKNEGKKIAKALVEHHLAACVNLIDKVESVFSWDGEICDEKEVLMIIKTKKELFEKVKFIVQKLHSYTVPELIALPIIQADETYLKWIEHETED
ncbi:MAG: divalent-cation tolerance protein CutA [Candidatus Gastranaerophilales bacterium]|nr:divalent-cation tolerance protein CutA [Candidatus Gastranaerophilales bacterium]